jgi:uncharacterized protein (DUF58 family)
LAQFLYLQGDGVGLITFDEGIRDYLPARHRTGQLRNLMLALEKPAGGQATELAKPLKWVNETVRKRGLLVIISDFLAPLDQVESQLTAMHACGHEVVLFQVLDPAERDFPYPEASLFEDLESGRTLYIDPAVARKDYLRRFNAHGATLRSIARQQGLACEQLDTSRPLELALFEFLRVRLQSGRRIRRVQRFSNATT